MHLNLYMVLGSAVVGLLVGLTGAGGGALMTPMLILLFGVTPSSAISSDLVAAVLMRPFGAAVHLRKGTVNMAMVRWMVLGSVPTAFLGPFLLHEFGGGPAQQKNVELLLGAALLIGAGAMVFRYALDRRAGRQRLGAISQIAVRPIPTIAIGAIGGLIVGLTSVGSGSLMIVLLLFVYPLIGAKQLVGTDLTQAVPLTAAAALGALFFGHVEFGVTASIVLGSVPAVLVGSFLSSRAPDHFIRPVITFVIFASGLKYIGVGTTALGWILSTVVIGGVVFWLARYRPWHRGLTAPASDGAPPGERAHEPAGEPAGVPVRGPTGRPADGPVGESTSASAGAQLAGSAGPDAVGVTARAPLVDTADGSSGGRPGQGESEHRASEGLD